MQLENRVAVITGGKRIGHTVALDLARAGAAVALSYRGSREQAEATAEAVRALGRRAVSIQADVGVAGECRRLIDAAAHELGRLDILINMASIYAPVPLAEITEAVWEEQHGANLRSTFFCAQAAVPHLRRQGGGRIINVADWVAASGRPAYEGFIAYYTAKAGVVALTEALALELAGDRILVNAVAPGPILPPPDLSPADREAVAAATPLGRWGGADEIAKAVRALIDSDFITGETLRVDGGRHLK